jgi:hypothetical protein
LFLKGKINITDISLNNRWNNHWEVTVNMPDWDKWKIFEKNKWFLINHKDWFKDSKDVLQYMDSNLGKMTLSKKRNLAKLLLASSFETFYFWILHLNNQSSIKNNNLIDNIINHKHIEESDIDKYLQDLWNDNEENIDKLIKYCSDALKLSTNEDIRRTVPVVQKNYDEFHNEANTLWRFSKWWWWIQIVNNNDKINNIEKDSLQIYSDSLVINEGKDSQWDKKEIINSNNKSKEKKEVVIEKETTEKIKKVLVADNKHYKNIWYITVTKWIQGRDMVWGNTQVRSYIIRSKYKDIDWKIITKDTDKSRLPSSLISQFLSLDGKEIIHPSKLKKLYIGEKIYIVLPK